MPYCPRAEIRSQRLIDVAAYLESKRRDDGSIGRDDIDPIIDIPRLASCLMLAEQEEDGRQRVRLMGSKAVQIMGGDFTGKWIGDLAMKRGPDWPQGGIDRVFAADSLFCGYVRLPWTEREHIEVEWIAQRMMQASGGCLVLVAFDHRQADRR
jgi:hypothetical protein